MSKKKATMDGNTAAAHVAYAFSDVAAIYPITPSSTMGELADLGGRRPQEHLRQGGRRHRDAVRRRRRRSRARLAVRRRPDHHLHRLPGPAADDPEHVQDRRRAAAHRFPCHAPATGLPRALHLRRPSATSWPAARPALPCWPAARAGSHGPGRWCAHLATLKAPIPFLHFFDGFRTSHEVQKIEEIDYEDSWQARRPGIRSRRSAPARCNPEHPDHQGRRTEPRHLLPGPRDRQPLLRGGARQSCKTTWSRSRKRPAASTTCSTTSAHPDADRCHHRHGLRLRDHRGNHRLPQRATAKKSA